jgi:hypothetical protein
MPKICQSCGMPMEKPEDFGTNLDGSSSEEYCRYCYASGKFTDEGITMEEKVAKNIEIAVGLGMSEDEAKILAEKTIPTLGRWRSN